MTKSPVQDDRRVGLLVSVRDAAEAVAALRGGADVIDVKEPSRGALGAADASVVETVAAAVDGRAPVSFAAGELCDWTPDRWQSHLDAVGDEVAYAKFGLSGCRRTTDWHHRWQRLVAMLPAHTRPVSVAYADWELAAAPPPEIVLQEAVALGCAALLVDTWDKRGGTLFDHWSTSELRRFADRVRDRDLPLVLAGSLAGVQLAAATDCDPALVAVRGAACGGDRRGRVSVEQVAAIRATIGAARPALQTACQASPRPT